ncbi:invasion associated locus B family protein [Sphingomonas radiodurans]|uniref:invasion associated locus B family protein n=1 Tax=Sphingomonas radiodurans TaxID=2890321 RepID=UPI001E2E1E56|nr:invasion associated locus B family protein [Sphingomonas radiodurans]WBH17437.1 invasion associated locus B family protein [Sphingomonas radiodurans]
MSLLFALLLTGNRTAIGVYDAWGAFRDARPPRCYAISAAVGARSGGPKPFASVAARFGSTRRAALFVRLSTARDVAAPVTLAIGERRFALAGNARAAWAPDAATDRAIVAAMRGGRSMSVSGVSTRGRPFADSYALGGAATAIDAAVLGCAR